MPWTILGIIGAPLALILGLWMGWVQAVTIPRLENQVVTLKLENKRLDDAIEDPVRGWRARLKLAEGNVVELRSVINEQNTRLDALAAAKAESDKRVATRIAAIERQRDAYERRITAYQNLVPQEDIPQQAIDLIRGRFGR